MGSRKNSPNYKRTYQYVWGEWFRLVDEVIADPRCQVDRDIVLKRLEFYPIQEAVKLNPWRVEDIQPIKRLRRFWTEASFRRILKRLRQGVPFELRFESWPNIYKQVAPENPIPFKRWHTYRVMRGWNIYSAFQDFWHIFLGKKYANYEALRREFPWLSKSGWTRKNGKLLVRDYEFLERMIAW